MCYCDNNIFGLALLDKTKCRSAFPLFILICTKFGQDDFFFVNEGAAQSILISHEICVFYILI